jgi:hypothetical protein
MALVPEGGRKTPVETMCPASPVGPSPSLGISGRKLRVAERNWPASTRGDTSGGHEAQDETPRTNQSPNTEQSPSVWRRN